MGKYSVEMKERTEGAGAAAVKGYSEVISNLEGLETEARPKGSKKLKGGQHEWRIRIGDYRAVHLVDDVKLLVSVTRIRHRSAVYEG